MRRLWISLVPGTRPVAAVWLCFGLVNYAFSNYGWAAFDLAICALNLWSHEIQQRRGE